MKMQAVFCRNQFAALDFDPNASEEVARPDNHLRRIVKRQNISGNDRPGNENDCGGNSQNDKRGEQHK